MDIDEVQRLLRRGEILIIPSSGLTRVISGFQKNEIEDLLPSDVAHYLQQRAKNSLKKSKDTA